MSKGRGPSMIKRVFLSEFFILYVSIIYFFVLIPFEPRLGSPRNLQNIFSNMLPLLMVAVGQTYVLITAGIDLSVMSTIAFCSVIGASIMTLDHGFLAGSPMAVPLAILAMLAIGCFIGFLNGAAIAFLQMPPFIVTLTSMIFFEGLAIWYSNWFTGSRNILSNNISHFPPLFEEIDWGSFYGIPYPLFIALFVVILAMAILRRTVMGRWIHALGHNPNTARISGVPLKKTVLFTYMFCGFCAALASVIYTSRLGASNTDTGDKLLNVIGAVVIGGTSLFGGKGKIPWTIYGVLFITLIENTLNMYNLSFYVIIVVKGGIILAAAFLDAVRNRLATESS
ncbi:hypothetical protein GF373_11105 [bacterium]|nr:hypothetical protein [bacterium]